ncbi:sensor histidine kinase [Paraflavitalea soli]|uniref:Sensor histidine kinase n=1 Tax=Paraflavitalea soli TaxID=2315862 RepID=A0A3B7MMH4_9BACT|nr:histidine kinase [Paraflavitalea soli]AXY74503.1 sensor histidine kinase [Paraflavitalea soli]
MKSFYIANNRVLTHILFWVGYMAVYTGVHTGDDDMMEYFLYEVQRLPGAMLVAYVNMYLLYPRFFVKRQYAAYTIAAIVLLFVSSVICRIITEKWFEPLFFPTTTYREPIFVWYMLFKSMVWFLSPVLFFTLIIKILQQWFRQERRQQQVEKEKLSAELNFLKAQVHPHFLFNTLNNLYALTLQASPAAPTVVLKLSELMSYMLYDSQANLISLKKEVQHVKNYIELEKLRYNDRLEVSMNVSGDIEQVSIAPLLLIPFVENAFKHGVSNETDNVWVTIDIKAWAGWLSIKVENSYNDTLPAAGESADKNGIGLQNVTRRLNLMYPQAHELVIDKEPGRFSVDLKIKMP